jgi:hypothetical protein
MKSLKIILFLLALTLRVVAQDSGTQKIIRNIEEYNKLLSPSARQKVTQLAKSLGSEIFADDKNVDLYAFSASRINNQNKGLSSQEIDALVMLVMFDLWKSEEKDLKELINEIDKINAAKKRQREYLDALKKQNSSAENKIREEYKSTTAITTGQKKVAGPVFLKETTKTPLLNIKYTRSPKLPEFKDPGQMSASELEQAINATTANLKTLEEIDQLDQLALQDAMQKQAQIMQLMSNISKIQHDTLKGIIQNLR